MRLQSIMYHNFRFDGQTRPHFSIPFCLYRYCHSSRVNTICHPIHLFSLFSLLGFRSIFLGVCASSLTSLPSRLSSMEVVWPFQILFISDLVSDSCKVLQLISFLSMKFTWNHISVPLVWHNYITENLVCIFCLGR